MAHGVGNVDKVFPELAGYIFITGLFCRQFQRDSQQVQRVHRHPAGSIGLLDVATSGQWCTTVENADVVEAQESALEDIHALGIFTVHPPGEVEHELVEDTLQECPVTLALAFFVDLVNAPRSPRVNWRVYIAERPLVSRDLSVGMHVPFPQHQRELFFREVWINERERDAV